MNKPVCAFRSPARPWRVLALASAVLACAGAAHAAGKVYTTDADWGLGLLENLNFDISGQLQINAVGVGGKYIFIANHNEDSVSKIDTVANVEVARYKTFASPIGTSAGGHPSRVAIDTDGNAYVLNRMDGIGSPPYLMKILVDTAIDRNNNGVIDSSGESNGTPGIQPAEMKPLNANNNAAIQDERVAWIAPIGTGTSFGRALCIAPDGKLWVGVWNQSRYYRVDPSNGATLPIGPNNLPYVQMTEWSPYGCTIDKDGILWSANLQFNGIGRVDTKTGAVSRIGNPYGSYNYGIAQGNDKIYQAPYASSYGWASYDPVAGTWARSPLSYTGAGIAIDGAGNILSTDYTGVYKYAPNGTVLWYANGGGGTTYGVMVDGNNDVWVMNLSYNTVKKYKSTTGELLATLPTGAYPYVYTDGSGLTTKTITNRPQGTWTVVYDSGAPGTAWGKIGWVSQIPAGASLEVVARAAESQASLDLATYVPVQNNAPFSAAGKYIQVRARLIANEDRESPQLYELSINSTVASCDIDNDGDIDLTDVGAIRARIGQAVAANDPSDANGDGKITINDVRACTLRCTRAACATQ